VINLDPANDEDLLPYDCTIDIHELISLKDAMEMMGLGPNGGMIYCMSVLAKNTEWLLNKIHALDESCYLIIDLPGQVELYTHDESVRGIIDFLQKNGNIRLAAVHLVDSHYCADVYKFISVLLLSLTTMLHLELPHVNVLSKIDLIAQYGELPFGLEAYTDVVQLDYLIEYLKEEEEEEEEEEEDKKTKKKKNKKNDVFEKRFNKLSCAICELVSDFGLVNFVVLNIADKECMRNVLSLIDKANGYAFGFSGGNTWAGLNSTAATVPPPSTTY